MDKETSRERVEWLRGELNYHNHRYYVLDSPEITDSEYDRLMKELVDLESIYPDLINPDSPSQRVGAVPLAEFVSVEHTIPMLSLSNAMNDGELTDFDRRVKKLLSTDEVDYVVEVKIDGLAVELVYHGGTFVLGSTRGDGYRGEDITQNLRTIKSIPVKIFHSEGTAIPERLEVRGEVYIGKNEFLELNRRRELTGEPLFANPRNAGSGSVRQLDPKVTAKRKLNIYCYGISIASDLHLSSHMEVLDSLKKWGFRVNPYTRVCKTTSEIIAYHNYIKDIRTEIPYEIDGTVVKVNRFDYQERLGTVSRSPRWAIAVKFEPHEEISVIRDIIVGVGRTGALTPVAVLEPVSIGGVEVSRATLHNEDEIERKNIMVGDTVIVTRAGDVIPEVVRVLKEKRDGSERPFIMPKTCPVCDEVVVRPAGEAIRRCVNINCPAQIKGSIVHFASKRAMDIDGLGEKLVEQLVDKAVVRDVSDIYYLEKEKLFSLDRMADKSAQNILDAIETSKQRTLARFIFAMGIRHVGEHISALLADQYPDIHRLFAVTEEELIGIHEIGPEVSNSIVSFFQDEKNRTTIERILAQGVQLSGHIAESQSGLEGKVFVFTGTLSAMSRDEARSLVERLGGKTASSVSRNVDFVVTGEEAGSKLDKARNLGINILTEREFTDMMNAVSKQTV